jgi:hypothetical protein
MFKSKKPELIKNLFLTHPIADETVFLGKELDFFDREGYQLNGIEKIFHEENKVNFHSENRMARRVSDDALNVVLQHWFEQVEQHPNIFMDHSHILHRFGFDGAALEQIGRHARKQPTLWKMFHIKPKYGLDFCFDWIEDGHVTEVVHIEMDIRDYDQMQQAIEQLTVFIESKDWVDLASYIISKRGEYLELDDYAQAIWKAKITGLDQLNLPWFSEHYLNKPYYFSYLKVID